MNEFDAHESERVKALALVTATEVDALQPTPYTFLCQSTAKPDPKSLVPIATQTFLRRDYQPCTQNLSPLYLSLLKSLQGVGIWTQVPEEKVTLFTWCIMVTSFQETHVHTSVYLGLGDGWVFHNHTGEWKKNKGLSAQKIQYLFTWTCVAKRVRSHRADIKALKLVYFML